MGDNRESIFIDSRSLFSLFAPVQTEAAYAMDSSNLDDLESIERHLTNLPLPSAPPNLRSAVLKDVHRNLKAQRWDRRMAWAAVALLVVGVGINGALGWTNRNSSASQTFAISRPDVITRAAVVVAEATDAETGRQFARRLAALSGATLTEHQEAEIQREIKSRTPSTAWQKKDG